MTSTAVGFEVTELSTITYTKTTDVALTTLRDGDGNPTATSYVTDIYFEPAGSAALTVADVAQNCSSIQGYRYLPGNPYANRVQSTYSGQ